MELSLLTLREEVNKLTSYKSIKELILLLPSSENHLFDFKRELISKIFAIVFPPEHTTYRLENVSTLGTCCLTLVDLNTWTPYNETQHADITGPFGQLIYSFIAPYFFAKDAGSARAKGKLCRV